MPAIVWDSLSHDLIDDLFAAELEELHLSDRYEIHRVLGQGGQGTVYLAKDQHIGREVAIKCAHEHTVNAEVALLGNLANPAIPQVYDRGVAIDGTHYLVMQYMPGQRLDHFLQQTQPDLETRIALFKDIAHAVDHAHQQGILHRDLKPSNILVNEQGRASIIDWGLAAKGDPRSVCGSPHFAAPEQLDGQPADQRADIFALGVLLYFICSGELPYARRVTDFNEFRAVRAGLQRVPLQRVCAHAPRFLDRISLRAMAPQSGARYQDVSDLLSALNDHNSELHQSQQSWVRRAVFPVVILLLCVATGLAGVYWGQQHAAGTQEQRDVEDFVGPPPVNDINWEGIDWQQAASDDQSAAEQEEEMEQTQEIQQSPEELEPMPSIMDLLADPVDEKDPSVNK